MSGAVELYNNAYGNFASKIYEQVRCETYGEDIGQSGWMTVDEFGQFIDWLGLSPESHILDVGSGSGGPALYLAKQSGARVTGIDINRYGIEAANEMARSRGMAGRSRFLHRDACDPLPAGDAEFDAIICIDAIIHFQNRPGVLQEWYRVLKPGGRLLYTDTSIITGLVSKDEIAIRSSIGYFLFAPPGENERLLEAAGFTLLHTKDITGNAARVSKRWHDARAAHAEDLIRVEGVETFEGLQTFLSVVNQVSEEHRLSRYVYVAEKR